MLQRYTLLLLLSWHVAAFAQDSTLTPRARFFQPAAVHQVRLAPEGQRVYYRRPAGATSSLFYRTAAAPHEEVSVAFRGTILDWRPTFTGQLLVFLSETGGGRKLLLTSSEGKVIRDLTPFPVVELRLESLSAGRPDAVAVWIVAADATRDGTYLIELASGKAERLSPRQGFSARYYDGSLRLVAGARSNGSGGQTIFVRRGDKWEVLVDFDGDAAVGQRDLQQVISVSDDGRRLYLTDNHDSDKSVLTEWRLDTAAGRVLVADIRADILPDGAIIGADGWPQMVVSRFGDLRHHFLHGEVRRDFQWLDGQWNGSAEFAGRSADGRTWLVRRLDGRPARYYLFRRSRRELVFLFSEQPQLDSFSLARRQSFTVRTRDELQLPVHVYLPAGSDRDGNGLPDTLLPTILYVHDRPAAGTDHRDDWTVQRHLQLLADRGYAVINTELRGAAGYGKDMIRAGYGQWGGDMHRDLIDIANWATLEKIADGRRMAVFGWGYGGYAAAAALAFSPERFACGLSIAGPADLLALGNLPAGNSADWRRAVGDPRTPQGQALLRRQSPFHAAGQITKPILLATGARNDFLPKAQIDAFADALNRTGKKPVYFFFPDEGRTFQAPESWSAFWAIAERFLHDHLGGAYQPAGEVLKSAGITVVYGQEYVEGME